MRNNTKKKENGQGLVEYALIAALVGVIVILALSATGTSLKEAFCTVASGLAMEELCSDAVAMREDFADLSDWNISWGNWEIKDGQLHGSRWGGIFHNGFSGEDYTITIDVANLTQGNGYGVFFRSQNPDNPEGYIFQYDPGYGSGAFLFRKWVDGHELSPLAVEYPSDFDWHGEERQVVIDVEGDTFTAYVDGEEVISASDDTYQEGGIGLRVWDSTEADFDDLTVTTP